MGPLFAAGRSHSPRQHLVLPPGVSNFSGSACAEGFKRSFPKLSYRVSRNNVNLG